MMSGEEKSSKRPLFGNPFGILLIAVLAVVITAVIVAVAVYQFRNGGLCFLLSVAEIPCPACGLTRATVCALFGRFEAAFSYHPLFFVPYIMLGLGICSVPMKKYRKQLLAAVLLLLVAMLICWLIRLALGWRGYVSI